jgi:hypothetical protein
MSAEARRRGIVWDTIERLAFVPDNPARWLTVYERTLHKLWEVHATDVRPRRLAGFDAIFLNVACEYSVEANDRYSVRIINAAATTPACWCVYADPAFCSKAAFHAAPGNYPRQDRAAHLRNDVECVLDGMIFHPRTHAHGDTLGMVGILDGNRPALATHEVRLGGGIENAFVFLTHLRYQFCLLGDEARNQERSRLVDLFTVAIGNKRTAIPPAELFDFKASDDEARQLDESGVVGGGSDQDC